MVPLRMSDQDQKFQNKYISEDTHNVLQDKCNDFLMEIVEFFRKDENHRLDFTATISGAAHTIINKMFYIVGTDATVKWLEDVINAYKQIEHRPPAAELIKRSKDQDEQLPSNVTIH